MGQEKLHEGARLHEAGRESQAGVIVAGPSFPLPCPFPLPLPYCYPLTASPYLKHLLPSRSLTFFAYFAFRFAYFL
uniref:Uncharacterized protein n=2 Tax=Picea TaxID=3328 RepID=A0A101LXT7_PICGL|nr:hypothetical protein ABT39_MTgene5526 [Picea glauca]QHR91594.1 hypothetical protein Q903MT_gene5629 [Picea sitchensis]